jgi:hypothetical protein
MRVLLFRLLMRAYRHVLAARRRRRSGAYVAWTAAAGLAWITAALAIVWMIAFFAAGGLWWLGLLLGALTAGAAALGPLARAACVPLGRVRLAHACSRLADGGEDPEGTALVIGAWAAAFEPPGRDQVPWLEERLAARGRIGDAEIAAAGLLAAARGERDVCRLLLTSIADLGEHGPAVRELAGEWLAGDDAEHGAWSAIAARAAAGRAGVDVWPPSPLTFFLEGVAGRLGAGVRISDIDLVTRWLLARRRRATWPLLRRALAARTEPASSATAPAPPVAAAAALPAALAAQAACVRAHGAGALDAATLGRAAAAWDRVATDTDTRLDVLRRAVVLDAASDAGERALRRAVADAAADLAELALAAGVPLASLAGSAVLASAGSQARHRLLADLETAFGALVDRCADRRALPALDEWRAFLALRAAYRRAAEAGGLELRRLAYPHAHAALTKLAVWLWNDRREHVLSHAVSSWLLAEALAVGDAQAIEVHTGNTALAIPPRAA